MDQDNIDDEEHVFVDDQAQTRDRRFRLVRRPVQLITSARRSPAEDRIHREKVYLWLQLTRLPFLALSAISFMWWDNWPITAALFLISVPMPWIAVVIANARGEPRDKRTRHVYKPAAAREYNRRLEAEAGQRTALESPRMLPDTIDHNSVNSHDEEGPANNANESNPRQ